MVFQEIHPLIPLIFIFLPLYVHRTRVSNFWKNNPELSQDERKDLSLLTNKDAVRDLIGLPYRKHWRYWNSQATVLFILFFPFGWLWQTLTQH